MKKYSLLLLFLWVVSCGGPEPRKPVEVKTGSFMKESAERNKKLLAEEEKLIQSIIQGDSLHQYIASPYGSWYYYNAQAEGDDYLPQTDDLVTLTYNLMTLDNDTLYTRQDIGTINYKVDKQELFPGLRNSVKLLKERESATFLYPSSLGFGYHGDDNKIGTNVPLKSTISILKIEKQKDSIQN